MVTAALGAVAPRAAHADAKTEARAHLAKATELHAAGRFREVLAELTIAYALDPQPDVLYAIAQTHVALGDCTQAIIFYRRFLSTRPDRLAADAALEAIDVCEHAPPAPMTSEPVPGPPDGAGAGTGPTPPAGDDRARPPADAPASGPPIVTSATPAPRRWYHDRVGVGLVGGGVLLGAGAGITYALARGALDDAEDAPTYAGYLDLVDRGQQRRVIASVLAGGAVAATAVGAYHLWRHTRAPEVTVVPARGGGMVSWAGRF